jgi:hypothetical protein
MSERGAGDRADRDPTDWESHNPVDRIEGTGQNEGNAIQFSWWNLVLLIPLRRCRRGGDRLRHHKKSATPFGR